MLTQWFNPEPTFKGLEFAKELVRRGHEVGVLTGFPNYPGGKIYNGYKIRLFQEERMEGIPVLRVPLYPSHDHSSIRRIANYSSFSFSSAVIGTLQARRFDVGYVYHPPATIGFPAVILKYFRNIPFVYDIQDLWPDTLEATGMVHNNAVFWLINKWCQLIYKHAKRIVVLSPGFKQALINRGVPKDKIEVIYNWCEEDQIQTGFRNEKLAEELRMDGRFNIVFAGNMGKAQALDAVLDAAEILADRCPPIQFVFVGGGIDVGRLKKRVEDKRKGNIIFCPRRPMSEIGKILNLADVLLVHLKDDPLFRITVPSKTQAYLAAGRPILMGARGDAADLVMTANAGICCNPEDPKSIAQSIEQLFAKPRAELEAMGANGKKFYQAELSLEKGVRRFEEVFRSASAATR